LTQELENFNTLKEGLYQDFEESILRENKEQSAPPKPTTLESPKKQQVEIYEDDEED